MKKLLHRLGMAELLVSSGRALQSGFDRAVAGAVKRNEAPKGAESFGQDLDDLVRMWRKRGELDRDIKVELFRKADTL